MRNILITASVLACVFTFNGCTGMIRTDNSVKNGPPIVRAVKTSIPPVIDGKLDDTVWQNAPAYNLLMSGDAFDFYGKPVAATPVEGGSFQLAYDMENLYVAIRFEDSDIVANGNTDGQMHFKFGDVAELFLWPEEQTCYWELYATPKSMCSSFFYPGGGRSVLEEHMKNAFLFPVKASLDGTLNDWADRDRSWTAEMAVPVSELSKNGGMWGPGTRWRILFARYNYSRWLQKHELSAFPQLPKSNFHLRGCYALIEFETDSSNAAAKSGSMNDIRN